MAEKPKLPRHVGIIMDGNGRWAKKRGLPRTAGHVQGAKAFRECVENCRRAGIEVVTFYAFSTENWKRPKAEVDAIMRLFGQYLDEAMTMTDEDARFLFLGDPSALPEGLQKKIETVTDASADHTGITCCIAVNYGGRDEIVRAVRATVGEGLTPEEIDEAALSARLDTRGLPEVDLIIRPSGERRLSNFLIWQAAYAEYVFMDVLWPDFGEAELKAALDEFSRRDRRFGGV
ncbi:MAG: polyprenyl diphosphate synthase [Bacteroides sp.]|nr:polyprenyl diphosphate synthase [Eubacterium sp.]MCM1418705.1 polyprenyl diphosphate synthase [Roseburia sp.]MCM1462733.1 polyprenyl diphosphate synthase [Bacteroides sp.]